MTVVASLAVGIFCALLAGHFVGRPLEIRRWTRPRAATSRRALWLVQAGTDVTPRQFALGSVLVAAVVFAAAALVTGTMLIAIVPAVTAGTMPRAHFSRRRAARLRTVQVAWPDGLRDIGASISAGRSLTNALNALADNGPLPLREAFARFPNLSRMLGTVPALEVIKEELADPTSDRVIEVLILAYERGGSIVKQVLEDLVAVTTKDVKLLDEIESEGLEMKINARAVLVMPWFVLLALTFRAGPFRDFYGSPAGFVVVLVGAALSALGSYWISHLGRAHEERRVFGSSVSVPVAQVP